MAHLIEHGLLEAGEANMKQDDFNDIKLTAKAAKRTGEACSAGSDGWSASAGAI